MWPPFKASEGRLAQMMVTFTVTVSLLQTMEILAAVCMNYLEYIPIYFQIILSGWHCSVPQLWVCHHQSLGEERELGVLAVQNLQAPTQQDWLEGEHGIG